jgi:hypothetical protein
VKFLIRGKMGGKTTEAIKLAAKTEAYLVVGTIQEARAAAMYADKMGTPIRFPVTYDELLQTGMRMSHVRNIVIDDADRFLQKICAGLTIEGCTLTKG